jgi:amidase
MKYKTIFFLFISTFLICSESVQYLSISEFQKYISNSSSKRNFLGDYLEELTLLDKDTNSIISLYETNQLYRSYVYGRNKDWQGVPILLKDNIDAKGLANTAGSISLTDNFPQSDAHLVKNLKKAGFLILGKANLSEWANFRGEKSVSGWSSYGGQTRNPYNYDYSPCGSSSGSAAAVALGLVPVSIGTETNGSITCPASMNGVVGIKPTVGLVSRHGIIPISSTQDTAGPLARSVLDAAIVLQAISGKDPKDVYTHSIPSNYDFDALTKLNTDYLNGKRIGLIMPDLNAPNEALRLIEKVKKQLKSNGAEVIEVRFYGMPENFWSAALFVLQHEFYIGLNSYLKKSKSRMQDMESVIDFNKLNSKQVMSFYGQEYFIKSVESAPGRTIGSVRTENIYQESLKTLEYAKKAIDDTLADNKLDALVGLTRNTAWKINYQTGDTFENGWGNGALSAISGYPHITIPLDFSDGLPTGVSFMGSAWDEVKLLNMAYSFEQNNKFFPKPIQDKN